MLQGQKNSSTWSTSSDLDVEILIGVKPRPILVKFLKLQALHIRRMNTGTHTVYINEDLTKSNCDLFYLTRRTAKLYNWATRCQNGHVFIKTSINARSTHITCTGDLDQFIKQQANQRNQLKLLTM